MAKEIETPDMVTEPPSRNNSPLIIAIIVGLLLLCCCLLIASFGIWWLWNYGDALLGIG